MQQLYDRFFKRPRALFLLRLMHFTRLGLARVFAAALIFSIFASCAVGPDYVRPKAERTGRHIRRWEGWKQAEPQGPSDSRSLVGDI